MIRRETTFIAKGCKRCGGALRGELGDLSCLNCGHEPTPDVAPEVMAMRASVRRIGRRIDGGFVHD